MIKRLDEITIDPPSRYSTGFAKLDLLLGGGIAKSSTTLLGGTTGAGKSTMLIQISDFLAKHSKLKILYICGEENQDQVKMRAKRLNINSKQILISETIDVEQIMEMVAKHKPDLVITDSLQMLYTKTMRTAPGTPSQMRHALMTLCKMVKHLKISIIFIGHATKGGYIAGLQTIQHLVDVVLFLELDEQGNRSIIARKNRFGASGDSHPVFMGQNGLSDLQESLPENINSIDISLNNDQLNKLLKNHPIWSVLVRNSLHWLDKQAKEHL